MLERDCTFFSDHQRLSSILKSCAAVSALKWGKSLHAGVVKFGQLSCQVVSKALLNTYAKCGALNDANALFVEMGGSSYCEDPVFWNILLSGFAGSRVYGAEAHTLRLFQAMHAANEPRPSSVTAAIILPVCARLHDLYAGKGMHCYTIKSGLDAYTNVGNALVSMYAKCGLVHSDACAAFYSINDKDAVSWNAMIAGFAENKLMDDAFRLFCLMLKGQIKPNYATFVNILPICASMDRSIALWFGKEIHGYILRQEEDIDYVSVWNALLSLYLRVGQVEKAELLFQRMEVRDLVSWNAIIGGCASNGAWEEALEHFHELLAHDRIELDSVTLVSIIPACAKLKNLQLGREIHGYVLRHPALCEDTSVGNALISFYAKCENIEAAYKTFFMIPNRDLISWNSMLDALVEGGYNTSFLEIFKLMLSEGISLDSITILALVRLGASVLKVDAVKESHSYSIRHDLLLSDAEPTLANAILDSYSKCGNVDYAFKVFENLSEKRNLLTFNSMISAYVNCGLHDDAYMIFSQMPARDLTTWNLMVRVYAENGFSSQALIIFREMLTRGMQPDTMTIMSLLPVGALMASADLIKQCHGYVIRSCSTDVYIKGAMLDVYAKCGSVGSAFKLFQSIPDKDLVIFTAMVRGFAMNGIADEALGVFSQMLDLGIKPDHIVITTVLSACSHAGLLGEGLRIFHSIKKVHGMEPTMEQYSCVVDLLARAGRIDEAYSLVAGMPKEASANVWGTLLGACKTHHEVELGRTVAEHLFKIEANNIGNYVVLSNLYAADARWDGVMEIRKLMKTRDLKKPAGCSWIELDRQSNVFVAGDTSHPQRNNIYSILSTLDCQIKEPFQLSQKLDFQLLDYRL